MGRFIFIYIVLTVFSLIGGNAITLYLSIYNIGMAAFCCLFGDILTWLLNKTPKKEE